MIRFCEYQFKENEELDVIIASECVEFDKEIWNAGKDYFRHNFCDDTAVLQVLPVIDKEGKIICYAYQDREANRELRMLKELGNRNDILQFREIFSDIHSVIVCGCNELAYYFVRYLEEQEIDVRVIGKYWHYFGYENDADIESTDQLVVYAEGNVLGISRLYQTMIKSVSPEFECIDKIYEANVCEGKIKNTINDFAYVLSQLKEKKVVILGTSVWAQDAYDLLYKNGIDIFSFVKEAPHAGNVYRTLLGKKIVELREIINDGENVVFVNATDRNSALGIESVEFLDYFGYERNKQYFFLKDYLDIPCSNLVHVLKGKTVRFAGNEQISALVIDYIKSIEQADINIGYIKLSQCRLLKETDILCIVNPSFTKQWNIKLQTFNEELSAYRIISFTDYFSYVRSLVLVDLYRTRKKEKYTMRQLIPKGVLLGRIPAFSGNIFFKEILIGHPNIIQFENYTALSINLFLYCICLAYQKPKNILTCFEKMYKEDSEGADIQPKIQDCDKKKFERSMKVMLSMKESFTSQELFMIFHIAYMEMKCGEKILDFEQKVIYWEPHDFPRDAFPFLADWLEDEKIEGFTMVMHRDHSIRAGSYYRSSDQSAASSLGLIQYFSMGERVETEKIFCRNWKTFHVRFEDIKLHPQEELVKVCNKLEIPWSDAMLDFTVELDRGSYQMVSGFDLKPVFNKNEEYFSEFDRFRIILVSSPYQKTYGYSYGNCLEFSRKELQEMFLKKFRFQQKLKFKNSREKEKYYLHVYLIFRQELWEIRKHMILDDILPQFGKVEI